MKKVHRLGFGYLLY